MKRRSKYMPHQGERERFRRALQTSRKTLKPPPQARASWSAHVRLIREMGPEDDLANCRSLGILLTAQRRTADLDRHHPYCPKPAAGDQWIGRARTIYREELKARGVPLRAAS